MQKRKITHIGFSDESHWSHGQFRSIGLVTIQAEHLQSVEDCIRGLADQYGIKEFKWKRLKGPKYRSLAQKLCEVIIENALRGILRVDVLIWNIYDSRHNIPDRDDIANLQRMYYHLFRNVLRVRWSREAVWRLCPDEHTSINWETVQDFLENTCVGLEADCSLLTGGQFRIRLFREFDIEEIRAVSSDQHPLLQVADLFAGLAVFSYEHFGEYEEWLLEAHGQLNLSDESISPRKLSQSSRERFELLKHFDGACKRKKLGVSLKKNRGLWTPNPQAPINFWLYEPQHPMDKAPQRVKDAKNGL